MKNCSIGNGIIKSRVVNMPDQFALSKSYCSSYLASQRKGDSPICSVFGRELIITSSKKKTNTVILLWKKEQLCTPKEKERERKGRCVVRHPDQSHQAQPAPDVSLSLSLSQVMIRILNLHILPPFHWPAAASASPSSFTKRVVSL